VGRGPTINWQRLEEIRAIQRPGGGSLLERVIQLFEQESVELLSRLGEAVERREAEAVRAAAHKFKSLSGNVGADALAACCHELEQRGQEGRLDDSTEILEEIRGEHARASAALSSGPGARGTDRGRG
jgi:HPt (histidine-containing phosphotransfer) domain-containing protein